MFLRKLFKIGDKLKWLSLELLIVFIGVYLAFLFQNYNEQKKVDAEREKVLVSLKKEVEQFRIGFPLQANGQRNNVNTWREAFNRGEVAEYTNWRFLEPQYNFQVIEYALNLNGTETLEFELYESLLELYRQIKQLEHAERLMTDLGHKYDPVPDGISQGSEIYKVLNAKNLFHFRKFINFANDRAGNLEEVAKLSEDVVKLINNKLSFEQRQAIMIDLLHYYYPAVDGDAEFLRNLFKEKFDDMPQDVIEQELQKLSNNNP